MARGPVHPLDLPDGTTSVGVFGWMAESLVRSYAVRLAGLVALLGMVVALVTGDAPVVPRVGAVVVGLTAPFVLLLSQLSSWRRSRQWMLVVLILAVCGSLLALVVSGP